MLVVPQIGCGARREYGCSDSQWRGMSMVELGINVDARGNFDPAEITAVGLRWVGSVIHHSEDHRDWFKACHDNGLRVHGILARESFPNWEENWSVDKYRPLVQEYIEKHVTPGLVDS